MNAGGTVLPDVRAEARMAVARMAVVREAVTERGPRPLGKSPTTLASGAENAVLAMGDSEIENAPIPKTARTQINPKAADPPRPWLSVD